MNCVIHGPWLPALLPALLDWPVLLYSMHIAFIELIIDPACPQAFENQASEHNAMRLPPRHFAGPVDRGQRSGAGYAGAADCRYH